MSQSRNIRLTVAVLVAVMLLLVAGFVYRIGQPQPMTAAELNANGLYLLEPPRSFGELKLTDHHGAAFDNARLRGQWTLVFFGFTHCPDICPTTMSFLNGVVGELSPDEQEDTQVVMVSVDPARDTVAQLASYVPFFNPRFTGVTGDFLDIHRFATALNTPFRKISGADGNYQVDHGSNVILINPRGDYHGFFRAPLDQASVLLTYRAARARWDASGR